MTPTTGGAATLDTGHDNAQALKDQAKQATQEIVDTAKEKGGQIVEQTKDQLRSKVEDTKSQVVSQITTQKGAAADSLNNISSALRQTGESLQGQGQGQIGGYASTFAQEIEGIASYVRDKDIENIAHDVESFARQRPALFIGAAFLAGVALARFLKSSAAQNSASGSTGYVPSNAGASGSQMMNSGPADFASANAPTERYRTEALPPQDEATDPPYVPSAIMSEHLSGERISDDA